MLRVSRNEFIALTEAIADENARASHLIEQQDIACDITETENLSRDLFFLKRRLMQELHKNARPSISEDTMTELRNLLHLHADHFHTPNKKVLEVLTNRCKARRPKQRAHETPAP